MVVLMSVCPRRRWTQGVAGDLAPRVGGKDFALAGHTSEAGGLRWRLGVCLQWNVLFLRVWLEKDLKQLRQWPGNQIFGRSRRRTSPICDRLGEWAGAPWLCRAGA